MSDIKIIASQTRALVKEWKDCKLCPIGKVARSHVFYRGNLEAKVAFIGEGPGKSEDILGEPFVGRAGKLLDQAIRDAGQQPDEAFFTNLVACRPCDGLRKPNRAPSEAEVANCSDRLRKTLQIVLPGVIVWLGKVPQHYSDKHRGAPWLSFFLPHPAWILRCGGVGSEQYSKYVLKLREVYKYAS